MQVKKKTYKFRISCIDITEKKKYIKTIEFL